MNGTEKLSLAKCKALLHKMNPLLSDEQIIAIRDFLYRLAEFEYEAFIHKAKSLPTKIINLIPNPEKPINHAA